MLSESPRVPRGVALSSLFPDARIVGARDLLIQACATDVGRVRPGDLFVAVDGPDGDGHDDAAEAVQRGAVAIVAERYMPLQATQCLVSDSRAALAELSHTLLGDPSRSMPVLALLDGVEASVPAVLVSAVLEQAGLATGIAAEQVGVDARQRRSGVSPLASPLSVARWLAECNACQSDYALLGVTPDHVARRAVHGTGLSHLVMTGLSPDRGLGFASPRRAAESLIKQLGADGLLIFNRDDMICRTAADSCDVPSLSYGLGGDAQVRGQLLERYCGEQTLLIEAHGDYAAVQTKPFGPRYASYCVAAAAVGVTMGIPLTEIARALEQVHGFSLWLEPVACGLDYQVFLDQAADPWSVRQALKALKGVVPGRLICVASADMTLTPDERAITGRTLEVASDVQVLAGDPAFEPSERRAALHDMLNGFARPGRPTVCLDRARAIMAALDMAQADDVVLVLGCQHASNRQAGARPDREIVEAWLRGDRESASQSRSEYSEPERLGNTIHE